MQVQPGLGVGVWSGSGRGGQSCRPGRRLHRVRTELNGIVCRTPTRCPENCLLIVWEPPPQHTPIGIGSQNTEDLLCDLVDESYKCSLPIKPEPHAPVVSNLQSLTYMDESAVSSKQG